MRKVSSASFSADQWSRDHYLNEGILKIEKGITIHVCMERCEGDATCQSFSFSEGDSACMLSNKKREESQRANYVYKKGYVYYYRL